mgnify:CR=1 FL=1
MKWNDNLKILNVSMVIVFALAADSALTDDGAIEINQACVSLGCFDGDEPGWPITIENAGSYILTSNLAVDSTSDGIVLEASRVFLDLGGHLISGGNECTGEPPVCTAKGALRGIFKGAFNFPQNITIHNGSVAGFTDDCLRVSGSGVVLHDLQISSCGSNGILHQGQGMIDRVVVRNAIGNGIQANGSVIVRESYFLNNGGYGVNFGICSDNVFSQNGESNGQSVGEENCSLKIHENICDSAPCP